MKTISGGVIVVLMVLLPVFDTVAQEYKNVSGVVTTFRNYPVYNVKVVSAKTGETVYTDSLGTFSVKSVKEDRLSVSASGFEKREVEVKRKNVYEVDLVYIDNESNFRKATEGGHISADALRKAMNESVIANKKDFAKYNSIYELVSGEVYNVRVNGKSILSTKVRSFDSSPEVLLVVNDRIVSDISYVEPGWVRSIELVDDVRASMYGSMGANGVLRIILK
jgi:hypothetical protein